MLVSIFMFAFLGWPDLWVRILSRVVLMPLVAGISYEIIRFAGNNCDKAWVLFCMKPGLWLQYMTTREPSDDQIEVAIRALEAVRQEPETAENVAPLSTTPPSEGEEREELARKAANA
jgi:uncharacterized protein YqhQ